MRPAIFVPLLAIATACGRPADQPSAPHAEELMVAAAARPLPPPTEDQRWIAHIARMKRAIRLHAAADFTDHCQLLDIPEEAFIPIELNGDGMPEMAVAYGRVGCSAMGASGFSSTGGSLVQFWAAVPEEAPVRMLAQAHMLGFTPGNRTLVTQQHGSSCGLPGAAGCQVTYRWATLDFDRMTVEHRPGGAEQRMAFNHLEGSSTVRENGRRNRAEQLARLRAAIRQDARLNYGEYCGAIELPDNAFYEIEITGDDFPEFAISLGRAICPARGANGFNGTGGAVIQIWHMARDYEGRDGPVRLLLETAMRGFTSGKGELVTIEHGARCLGVAPGFCRVVYRWDAKTRHLDTISKSPSEAGPESMRFSDRQLW